jgi:hypothetical protein
MHARYEGQEIHGMITYTSVLCSEKFVSLSIHINSFQTNKKIFFLPYKISAKIIGLLHNSFTFVIGSRAASHSLFFPSTTTHMLPVHG